MKKYIAIIVALFITLVCKGQCTVQDPCFEETIIATTAYLGQFAKVTVTVDDANNDNEITHPLIVAEGFDLGVVIAPEQENGYQDYSDFRDFLLESGNNLQALIRNANKDYDIIYVDWDNGIDYLQRNAYALEAVIAWVNSVKQGNEKNVILGQSMGGVIARWALADMEERNLDHDTRLFISHDAPQQGANIPAGLQFLYRHGNNQYAQLGKTLFGSVVTVPLLVFTPLSGVSDYLSLLDAPATKQLLKNRATTGYTMVNTEHTTFHNQLRNKGLANSGGYPVNCRNIALSNGSECGNTQNFTAGEHLVDFQWNKGLSFWEDLGGMAVNPLGGLLGGLFVDNSLYGAGALGLIPGHSKYNVDIQARSIPYGSGNQIYKGTISYTKKVLWLFNVTSNITNVQKNQPAGVLPFDTYGGGYYNVNGFLDTNTLPSGAFIRDRFGFIPTASALDIGENNVTLNNTDYLKEYVGGSPPGNPKNSPFDNFSTEFDTANPNAGNYSHISFNTRNGNWLADEISGITTSVTDCNFACGNTFVSGPSSVCASGASFSIAGLPSNATIVWTSSSNITRSSSQGANPCTFSASGSGNGWIKASISSSGCGNPVVIQKNLDVGVSTSNVVIGNVPPSVAVNTPIEVVVGYPPMDNCDILDAQWWQMPNTTIMNGSFPCPLNNNTQKRIIFHSPGTYYIQAKVKTSCGWTNNWSAPVTINVTSGGYYYAVYPNPSSSDIFVSKKQSHESSRASLESKDDDNAVITMELYNFSGKKVRNLDLDSKSKEIKMNVLGMPKGNYFLHITNKKVDEVHQIIIE